MECLGGRLRHLEHYPENIENASPAPAASAASSDTEGVSAVTVLTSNQARLALWLTVPTITDKGLARLGIDRTIANRAGGLAWSRITIFGRGFDLSPSGIPAVIQPVWRGPAPSLECGIENPILDELIAWRPVEPGEWWYRWGASWPALGDHYIDDAHIDGLPLDCHLTPLDWLRSGCRGCVLLEIAEGYQPMREQVAA